MRLLIPFLVIILGSCYNPDYTVNPNTILRFSTDTCHFDTLFSGVNSSTQRVLVYNNSSGIAEIQRAYLSGGSDSFFRVNMDGEPGYSFEDIRIMPKDSLFIFIEGSFPVSGNDVPIQISDSIIFQMANTSQKLVITGFSQDVYHHLGGKGEYVSWNAPELFQSDRPHLIDGNIGIPKGSSSVVKPGAKLYFNHGSSLNIEGSLIASGTEDSIIEITSSRREDFYTDKPSQWNGIFFFTDTDDNILDWVNISNAINGIVVGGVYETGDLLSPSLQVNNCRIENMSSSGIWAIGANLRVTNSLVSQCGVVNLYITLGGSYDFTHCTIANYWGSYTSRKGGAVIFSNSISFDNNNFYKPIENVRFTNSIVYGSLTNEIEFNKDLTVNHDLINATFINCILKLPDKALENVIRYQDCLNANPEFLEVSKWEYRYHSYLLTEDSPAIGIALESSAMEFPIDLNGNNRMEIGQPDIGAFQYVPDNESDMQ